MMTRIRVERFVDCPYSDAHEYAREAFGEWASFDATARLPLHALGLPLPGALCRHISVAFRMRKDIQYACARYDALDLSFAWRARSKLIPDLEGRLHLRIAGLRTRLILTAHYHPPGAIAGKIFDRLVGRHLARATARDVLDRLAAAMERRERLLHTAATAAGA